MDVYVNDAQACRRFQRGSLRTGAQQLCNRAQHSTVQRRSAVQYCKELEAILQYTKITPTQTHPHSTPDETRTLPDSHSDILPTPATTIQKHLDHSRTIPETANPIQFNTRPHTHAVASDVDHAYDQVVDHAVYHIGR